MPGRSGRDSKRGRPPRSVRRETDLRRRPAGSRAERRTVLVVTNGNRTEVDYFEAVRKEQWVTAGKVRVKFEKGTPADAVSCAAAIRDDNEYDEAWAVCDTDEFEVKSALANARELEVELTLSVPCFEVWLILHLSERCPSFNNATQAGTHLKRLLSTWDKTALRFKDFQAGLSDAVDRAKRLGEPPDANPSTAVWRLIDSLRR